MSSASIYTSSYKVSLCSPQVIFRPLPVSRARTQYPAFEGQNPSPAESRLPHLLYPQPAPTDIECVHSISGFWGSKSLSHPISPYPPLVPSTNTYISSHRSPLVSFPSVYGTQRGKVLGVF
ncbi:hypothetical protein PILCRDRAFT_17499 [Piloderma croceum F 1598]|uniref:Uncharacterized protein n=1 Tax=Piloderma croceum (strain F 1598) TaxID=765440 RepID=A0A0C3ESC4_PILCF|nr:hypothetical protein PILCRDRAFT_17499 [Piloderma croceum F 1598]